MRFDDFAKAEGFISPRIYLINRLMGKTEK